MRQAAKLTTFRILFGFFVLSGCKTQTPTKKLFIRVYKYSPEKNFVVKTCLLFFIFRSLFSICLNFNIHFLACPQVYGKIDELRIFLHKILQNLLANIEVDIITKTQQFR